MRSELVVCGIPFGTPEEKEALRQVEILGFTAVQIYTFWRDYEPITRSQFDRTVAALRKMVAKNAVWAVRHHDREMGFKILTCRNFYSSVLL
jgi:hypothetical protein